MVAMKELMDHASPLLLAVIRLLPSGIALVGWAKAAGRPMPSTALAWAWITAFAVVDGAGFQAFLAQGLQRTTAGLGSVIIDSQPLTVALLASILFGERLGLSGVAGLLVGVCGLLLLECPPSIIDGFWQSSAGASAQAALPTAYPSMSEIIHSGEFSMLLAAQSMALGTVMVRYVTKHCDPVMATGWHMVVGGGMLMAALCGTDLDASISAVQGFSVTDYGLLTYVSMMGGAVSYGAFFYNASRGNLTTLSSLTFLTPMFAAAAGFLVLGETFTPVQMAGAVVTLVGVALINKK